MTAAGTVAAICSDTLPDSIRMVKDNLYLIPLAVFYAVALLFGLLGKKHLDASVVSPLENIDGAMAAILLYFFFLLTDRRHVIDSIGAMDMIGTLAITVGVILFGMQEHKLSKQEINLDEKKKKHRLGALALIFPLLYNLVDVVSIVATSITVSEETEVAIPDIDFFCFESLGFLAVAVFLWFYLLIVKKYKYNPFKKGEAFRCGAATGETLGAIAYIFAAGINPILTVPITSSYCFVTIVLAHILLKERLTKKQYLSLACLVIGIVLLGISGIVNA
jgi:drug/metabolite transporter (DMT)-like permease